MSKSWDGEPPSLRQLFLQGWEARRKIDACELASGSAEHSVITAINCIYFVNLFIIHAREQKCVSEGVAVMERATEMASQMSLFSDNEDLVEVATSSLKWVKLSVVYHKFSLPPSLPL